MFDFRTDLADERYDIYKKANNIDDTIPGIETENKTCGDYISVTTVKIVSEDGEQALGKPKGNYVTINIKNLNVAGEEEIENSAVALSNELNTLIGNFIQKTDDILVVGLGNAYVTPDALGPKVVADIDITRHLFQYLPQYVDENTRPVSAVAPGVLGTTGIETVEILKGIIDNVKPKLVIVIDALAAKSVERISNTIQIADTGIVPGAGVGNARKELSYKTLGCPVIALGIPTVVEAAVIANEALDLLIDKLQQEARSNEYLNELKAQNNYEDIREALLPNDYNFIVTPKEIDELIENMSSIVARGINKSLN